MKLAWAHMWEPRAIARRTSIVAALAQVDFPGKKEFSYHPARIDDLSRLSEALDALGLSDIALACANADFDSGVARVAQVVYAARVLERRAKVSTGLGAGSSATAPSSSCPTLGAALSEFRNSSINGACAPRGLLDCLAGFAPHPTRLATLRMLAAMYLGEDKLIDALCSAPFDIERSNVQQALLGVSGSPREMLSTALVNIRGLEAKEAVAAAIAVFDDVRVQTESMTLTATLAEIDAAFEAHIARSSYTNERDSLLLESAATTDEIWTASGASIAPAIRVRHFLDSLKAVELDGITLIPFGCAGQGSRGALKFFDAPATPVQIAALARALDIRSQSLEETMRGKIAIQVNADLSSAVGWYLGERMRSGEQRLWPQPDSPIPVVAPKMTFSASRLNAYVKCPRRWFYDYLCDALEDPPSLNATYGRVIHDALEALHREVRVPSRHDPSLILERLLKELDRAFGSARDDFASQLEYETSRCRARKMAEQYVRWLVLEAKRTPLEVTAVEVLSRQRFGTHDFVGYIDRIDRPLAGGPITIYDYKTGRIDTDAGEYLEKVRRGDEAQLALYYAMRKAEGDDVARIALLSIRDPRDDVWMLALDVVPEGSEGKDSTPLVDGILRVRCTKSDLDRSLELLLERCDMLTTLGNGRFEAGEDPPCSYCAYSRACRERPLEGERIFAR